MRVADVSKDPRYINAIDAVRSELAVPLMYKGKAIGVLDIQSRQLNYFTHDQQNILTLLASRLAMAIENARLFQRARRQAETLLVLNEIARETSSILDLEKLLTRAAELIKRVIDYQILSILLYDESDENFSSPAGCEIWSDGAGKNARGGDGRNCRRGGGIAAASASAGYDGRSAILDGESGNAFGIGAAADSQESRGRGAGSGKSGAGLF